MRLAADYGWRCAGARRARSLRQGATRCAFDRPTQAPLLLARARRGSRRSSSPVALSEHRAVLREHPRAARPRRTAQATTDTSPPSAEEYNADDESPPGAARRHSPHVLSPECVAESSSAAAQPPPSKCRARRCQHATSARPTAARRARRRLERRPRARRSAAGQIIRAAMRRRRCNPQRLVLGDESRPFCEMGHALGMSGRWRQEGQRRRTGVTVCLKDIVHQAFAAGRKYGWSTAWQYARGRMRRRRARASGEQATTATATTTSDAGAPRARSTASSCSLTPKELIVPLLAARRRCS